VRALARFHAGLAADGALTAIRVILFNATRSLRFRLGRGRDGVSRLDGGRPLRARMPWIMQIVRRPAAAQIAE
jgi:hypothetical protein